MLGGRRLESVVVLLARARRTFERFPFALLSAIGAALVLHHLAGIEFAAHRGAAVFYPILMACALGIPLFISLRVLGEASGWPGLVRTLVSAAGALALLAYYLALRVPIREAEVFRFFLLSAALHLLVAFIPFAGRRDQENAFWQYNRHLFIRFALAALYSIVLYAGLTLAIAACETLLDLDLPSEIYLQLFFWVAFVYNTWFFLAGVPSDIPGLQRVTEFPTALRVFTQYVLIPLVVIYVLILYAYLAKILIEWSLPKGWVGYPIIGVSVAGILALLLVHPIRDRAGSAWISTYARWFYLGLLPLIGLMAVAIGTRIGDYGVTERRYVLVIATAWLLGIALRFSFHRGADIRIIPASLCALALISAFGPWSATAVSRRSQLERLRELLVREHVMVDGRLHGGSKRLPVDPEVEIANILRYLHRTHGLRPLRGWYAQPERLPEELTPELAVEAMGLVYRQPWERGERFSIDLTVPNPLPVTEFDYVYELSQFFSDDTAPIEVALGGRARLSVAGTVLRVARTDENREPLELDIGDTLRELRDLPRSRPGRPTPEVRGLTAEDDHLRVLFYLDAATVEGSGDSLHVRRLAGTLLIEMK